MVIYDWVRSSCWCKYKEIASKPIISYMQKIKQIGKKKTSTECFKQGKKNRRVSNEAQAFKSWLEQIKSRTTSSFLYLEK